MQYKIHKVYSKIKNFGDYVRFLLNPIVNIYILNLPPFGRIGNFFSSKIRVFTSVKPRFFDIFAFHVRSHSIGQTCPRLYHIIVTFSRYHVVKAKHLWMTSIWNIGLCFFSCIVADDRQPSRKVSSLPASTVHAISAACGIGLISCAGHQCCACPEDGHLCPVYPCSHPFLSRTSTLFSSSTKNKSIHFYTQLFSSEKVKIKAAECCGAGGVEIILWSRSCNQLFWLHGSGYWLQLEKNKIMSSPLNCPSSP